MKKTILFSMSLLIAGYFSSCEKETELTYPAVYKSSALSDVKVRLFIKDVEITDASTVQSFFNRYREFFTHTESEHVADEIKFTYYKSDSVSFYNGYANKTEYRSATETSDLIYFEKYDTTLYPFIQSSIESYVVVYT